MGSASPWQHANERRKSFKNMLLALLGFCGLQIHLLLMSGITKEQQLSMLHHYIHDTDPSFHGCVHASYQSVLCVLSPPSFSPLAAYLHLPSSCDGNIPVSPKPSAIREQLFVPTNSGTYPGGTDWHAAPTCYQTGVNHYHLRSYGLKLNT